MFNWFDNESARSSMDVFPYVLVSFLLAMVIWPLDGKKASRSMDGSRERTTARRQVYIEQPRSHPSKSLVANCSSYNIKPAKEEQSPGQLPRLARTGARRVINENRPTPQPPTYKTSTVIHGGSIRPANVWIVGKHAQKNNTSMNKISDRQKPAQIIGRQQRVTITPNSPDKTHEIIGHTALCFMLYLQAVPQHPSPYELDKARQKFYAWDTFSSKVEIGRSITKDSELRKLFHRCIGPEMLGRIQDYCKHELGKSKKPVSSIFLQGDVGSGDKRYRDAMLGDKALDLILYIEGQRFGLDRMQLEVARKELFSNLNLGGRSQATNIEAKMGAQIRARKRKIMSALQRHIDKATTTLLILSVNRYCNHAP